MARKIRPCRIGRKRPKTPSTRKPHPPRRRRPCRTGCETGDVFITSVLNRLWLGPLYKAAFILAAGKPLYTFDHPANAVLIEAGALKITDSTRWQLITGVTTEASKRHATNGGPL